MQRKPKLELSEVFTKFVESRPKLSSDKRRVISSILNCRTASLGYNVQRCSTCEHTERSYNSCRNRHCPKCQGSVAAKWAESRSSELLPVPYVHTVFTLPSELREVAYQNKRVVFDILFRAVSETMLEIGADKRHLGARLGFFAVLHTWNQKLEFHPHIHVVCPAGGLSPEGRTWVFSKPKFFLPVRVLSALFLKKLVYYLRKAYRENKLKFYQQCNFSKLLAECWNKKAVVYSKRPFGGPAQVVKYLANYTHRIAISNHRLQKLTDTTVTFRYRNSRKNNSRGSLTLPIDTFAKRFLLHTLPKGFTRIRHFGFYASSTKKRLLPKIKRILTKTVTITHRTEIEPFLQHCPICETGIMILNLVYKPAKPRAAPQNTTPSSIAA